MVEVNIMVVIKVELGESYTQGWVIAG